MEDGKETKPMSSERDCSQDRHSRKAAEALGAKLMGSIVREGGLCKTESWVRQQENIGKAQLVPSMFSTVTPQSAQNL